MSLTPALVTAAVTALTTSAVAPLPTDPDLSWMSGYWLDCSGSREASETWSDPRAGLMVGHAISLSPSGRPGFELAFITPSSQGLLYVVLPSGGEQTAFRLSDHGEGFVVFSNPDNDFPNHIRYEYDGVRLKARIDGEIDGQARSVEWAFDPAPLNSRCPT